MEQRHEDEGEITPDGSPSHYLNLNNNHDSQNAPASGQSSPSNTNEQVPRGPRGPNTMPKGIHTITALAADGKPIEPLKAVKAWKRSCGVIAKDTAEERDIFAPIGNSF